MIKHTFLSILILAMVATGLFLLPSAKPVMEPGAVSDTASWNNSHKVFNPPIPVKADFCGEPVPFNLFYVKEGVEREIVVNTFWHSNTMLLLKRAARWLPEVEATLKKNGVPDDIKYLLFIESGFDFNVSPAGAAGYWQLLDKTAKEYGLEVNENVDERYHLVKSTEAACKYLRKAYGKFGSWTLAAASYNTGMKRVEEEVAQQGTSNFYELLFSNETTRYISRIIAIKEIYRDPNKYGYKLSPSDLYQPVTLKPVKVTQTITRLEDFARENKTTLRMIKYFNPWLRSRTLPVAEGKSYTVFIP